MEQLAELEQRMSHPLLFGASPVWPKASARDAHKPPCRRTALIHESVLGDLFDRDAPFGRT